jgi:hypothetical protein
MPPTGSWRPVFHEIEIGHYSRRDSVQFARCPAPLLNFVAHKSLYGGQMMWEA